MYIIQTSINQIFNSASIFYLLSYIIFIKGNLSRSIQSLLYMSNSWQLPVALRIFRYPKMCPKTRIPSLLGSFSTASRFRRDGMRHPINHHAFATASGAPPANQLYRFSVLYKTVRVLWLREKNMRRRIFNFFGNEGSQTDCTCCSDGCCLFPKFFF